MNEALEVDQEVTTAGDANAPAPLEGVNRVDPSTPPVVSTSAIKEIYADSTFGRLLREAGLFCPETDIPESTHLDRVQHKHVRNVDKPLAKPSAMRTTASAAPPPVPPKHDVAVGELFVAIKRIIARGTHLSDHVSALLTFWVISTWLQNALAMYPCLVLTGPAHEAMLVLQTLEVLCYCPFRVGAFKSVNLKDIPWAANPTLLIYEPNLDKRMAALLGSSTSRGFLQFMGGYRFDLWGPKAIYVGDGHGMKSIPHSIHINVTAPASAEQPPQYQLLGETIEDLKSQLLRYVQRNLEKVRRSEFAVSGPSSETRAVANSLGRCIVDAPELQTELAALLMPHAQQQIADRSDSLEALVAGAAFALCHQGKDQIFVKEIATEVNRLQEIRGTTLRVSPEKAGHALKKAGLLTRRLSQAGNGLTLNGSTRALLHEVAATYLGEDSITEEGNLHCPLCTESR